MTVSEEAERQLWQEIKIDKCLDIFLYREQGVKLKSTSVLDIVIGAAGNRVSNKDRQVFRHILGRLTGNK